MTEIVLPNRFGMDGDQGFAFLGESAFSNNFSLSASLKNSVTPAYPFSGCFLIYSSTSLYSSSGMLRVLYFDTPPLCVKYNINDVCYEYVIHSTNFISNSCVIGNIWIRKGVTA